MRDLEAEREQAKARGHWWTSELGMRLRACIIKPTPTNQDILNKQLDAYRDALKSGTAIAPKLSMDY